MSDRAGEPEDRFEGSSRDYRARGMASEAQQAIRSHEALNDLQFKHVETELKVLKTAIDNTSDKVEALDEKLTKKIDDGFSSYNNKIIALLVTITLLLAGTSGTMVWYLLTKEH